MVREESVVRLRLATFGIEEVLQSVSRSARLHHVHFLIPLWPPQPRPIVYLRSPIVSSQPEASAELVTLEAYSSEESC